MKAIKCILLLVFFAVIAVGCNKYATEVSALAEELGVDPKNINSYGPGPFPLNYFLEQLCLSQCEEEKTVTRAEVQSVVLGFEINKECQYAGYSLKGDYSVIYLYYSKSFDSALKIVAIYQIQDAESSPGESDVLVELFYLDSPTQDELSAWRQCVESEH